MNAGLFGLAEPHCWMSPAVALSGGQTTWGVPFDRPPDMMSVRMVNQIAENNWKPGDEVEGIGLTAADGAGNFYASFGVGYSRTGDGSAPAGISLLITSSTGGIYQWKKYGGSGNPFLVTAANWSVIVRAIWFHP